MQSKYYQILFGRTCEWFLWIGGRFIEVIFKTGSTVKYFKIKEYNGSMDVVFQTSGAQQEPEQDIVVIVETEVTNT